MHGQRVRLANLRLQLLQQFFHLSHFSSGRVYYSCPGGLLLCPLTELRLQYMSIRCTWSVTIEMTALRAVPLLCNLIREIIQFRDSV